MSGAVAERITLTAYFTIQVVLTAFTYPLIVHWGWSTNGWASGWRESRLFLGCGIVDFAGSGVVHATGYHWEFEAPLFYLLTGGFVALLVIIMIGARRNRFKDGVAVEMREQSSTIQTLGMFLLWVGWCKSRKVCVILFLQNCFQSLLTELRPWL